VSNFEIDEFYLCYFDKDIGMFLYTIILYCTLLYYTSMSQTMKKNDAQVRFG